MIDFSNDGDDSVDVISKIISINNKKSIEYQFYTVLHECGHILVKENDSFEIKKNADINPEKTKAHKVFRVIEEIEAWKRGLTLCKRMGIPVDKKKWDKFVVVAIMNYMVWATKGD
jgi:hypothetical protein